MKRSALSFVAAQPAFLHPSNVTQFFRINNESENAKRFFSRMLKLTLIYEPAINNGDKKNLAQQKK